MIATVEDQLKAVDTDSANIVIASRILMNKKAKTRHRIHIGKENIGYDFDGLILPKRSPLLAPFNMV